MSEMLTFPIEKGTDRTIVELNTEYLDETNTALEVFEINWTLGNVCNYSCSYCPAFKHDASIITNLGETEKARIDWLLKSIKQSTGVDFFLFNFSGGEPTRVPGFAEFCTWLKSNHHAWIKINTNASRPISFWRENWQNFDRISMSFHSEFADVESFLEKYIFLSERLHTHVSLMMHPLNWEKCIDLAGKLKNLKKHVFSYCMLFEGWPNQNMVVDRRYTEEQLHFLRSSNGTVSNYQALPGGKFSRRFITRWSDGTKNTALSKQDIINRNYNNFKGWDCWVGLRHLSIDERGDIFTAHCHWRQHLGNIGNGKIEIPRKPVVCGADRCHCHPYIGIKKTRKIDPTT